MCLQRNHLQHFLLINQDLRQNATRFELLWFRASLFWIALRVYSMLSVVWRKASQKGLSLSLRKRLLTQSDNAAQVASSIYHWNCRTVHSPTAACFLLKICAMLVLKFYFCACIFHFLISIKRSKINAFSRSCIRRSRYCNETGTAPVCLEGWNGLLSILSFSAVGVEPCLTAGIFSMQILFSSVKLFMFEPVKPLVMLAYNGFLYWFGSSGIDLNCRLDL